MAKQLRMNNSVTWLMHPPYTNENAEKLLRMKIRMIEFGSNFGEIFLELVEYTTFYKLIISESEFYGPIILAIRPNVHSIAAM